LTPSSRVCSAIENSRSQIPKYENREKQEREKPNDQAKPETLTVKQVAIIAVDQWWGDSFNNRLRESGWFVSLGLRLLLWGSHSEHERERMIRQLYYTRANGRQPDALAKEAYPSLARQAVSHRSACRMCGALVSELVFHSKLKRSSSIPFFSNTSMQNAAAQATPCLQIAGTNPGLGTPFELPEAVWKSVALSILEESQGTGVSTGCPASNSGRGTLLAIIFLADNPKEYRDGKKSDGHTA
jgi:hypothetical protein